MYIFSRFNAHTHTHKLTKVVRNVFEKRNVFKEDLNQIEYMLYRIHIEIYNPYMYLLYYFY